MQFRRFAMPTPSKTSHLCLAGTTYAAHRRRPNPALPGMCAGFKAGTGNGHRLINETTDEVVYLEVGDRTPGDEGSYPDDDLKALLVEGQWKFVRKDGTPYA